MADPAIRKITLKNGIRVIFAPQPGTLAGTVLVLVEAGSEYETKNINGVSHFLEHMVFKGTANRPRADLISAELDALGGEYNAFTTEEYTGYFAKAEEKKVPQIIELVSDLYLNPLFEAQEIEKERGVIIGEISMYEDDPASHVHEVYNECMYGDQPAGWNVAGTREVIRSLTRDDFVAYRTAHYVPAKTVVVIAGAFDEAAAEAQITKLFANVPHGDGIEKVPTKDIQEAPRVKIAYKESAQSHFVLGTRAFPINDPRRHALRVLTNVLGGGMSSRLFHIVRNEMGAGYYVYAAQSLFLDHGQFSTGAGVDHAKLHEVIAVIVREMKKLTEELIPDKELQKAKDHLVGSMIMNLETSDQIANFYGKQEIMSKALTTPEEIVARVQAVTAEEIREVARAVINEKTLNCAVIGPHNDEASIAKLLTL